VDRSDATFFALVFGMFGTLAAVDTLAPGYKQYAFVGVMVGFVAFIFLQELYMIKKTAPFNYMRAVIRPGNKKMHFFFSIDLLKTKSLSNGWYATGITLGLGGAKTKEYGKIERFIIESYRLPADKRITFTKGKAVYQGYEVDHPNVADVTLQEVRQKFDIDHGVPIPIFRLVEAPNDCELGIEPSVVMPALAHGNPNPMPLSLSKDDAALKQVTAEIERQGLDWHQRAIHLEEVVMQKTNELNALLKAKADFAKSVNLRMLSIRKEQQTIENALKSGAGFKLIHLAWIAVPACFVALILYMQYNPQALASLQLWLSSPTNQVFTVILIGAILGIVYFLRRRGR